ncbi:hypothetical protein J3Q64DRAFT_1740569 [Phycomyces blakesleeanus]
MVAGAVVLLSRVQTISPEHWKKWTKYFAILVFLFRVAIGIADSAHVHISTRDNNVCIYADEFTWGALYTFLDTAIDLYATLMISFILITHIRRIHSLHTPASSSIYFAVLYHNVGRTFLLTVANLISAIFILSQIDTDLIIFIWTATNFLFVLLIGFDTDVTRSIRVLQKKYTEISNKHSSEERGSSFFSRAKSYIPSGSNEPQSVPPAHVTNSYYSIHGIELENTSNETRSRTQQNFTNTYISNRNDDDKSYTPPQSSPESRVNGLP